MLNNKEFYPTPDSLLSKLVGNRALHSPILEPSAGKGNIVEYIYRKQGKSNSEVYTIEKDIDLRNTLIGKGESLVWDDFLTYKSHRQYKTIIMNPPFSNGVDHLLKAISVAEGVITGDTHIYAILNANTLKNDYSNKRKDLQTKLNYYKADIEYVQDGFVESERTTEVEVALIRLVVGGKKGKNLYESLIKGKLNTTNDSEGETGLSTIHAKYSIGHALTDINRLVTEYNEIVKLTKEGYQKLINRNELYKYVVKDVNNTSNYVNTFESDYRERMELELDSIRNTYWEMVLNLKEFETLLTSKSRTEFLNSVSEFKRFEINLENIEYILQSFVANMNNILKDTAVEMFNKITQHSQRGSFTKNIHLYNGWYTNSAYKINKRFIYPVTNREVYMFTGGKIYDRLNFEIKGYLSDLNKVMGLFKPVTEFEQLNSMEYENNIYKVKIFNKGTIHVTFKDEEVLRSFNMLVGQHYKWIPSEDDMKTSKGKEFMEREFPIQKVIN